MKNHNLSHHHSIFLNLNRHSTVTAPKHSSTSSNLCSLLLCSSAFKLHARFAASAQSRLCALKPRRLRANADSEQRTMKCMRMDSTEERYPHDLVARHVECNRFSSMRGWSGAQVYKSVVECVYPRPSLHLKGALSR